MVERGRIVTLAWRTIRQGEGHGQFWYLGTSAEKLSRDTPAQRRYARYGRVSCFQRPLNSDGVGELLDQTSPTRKRIYEVDRRKDSGILRVD